MPDSSERPAHSRSTEDAAGRSFLFFDIGFGRVILEVRSVLRRATGALHLRRIDRAWAADATPVPTALFLYTHLTEQPSNSIFVSLQKMFSPLPSFLRRRKTCQHRRFSAPCAGSRSRSAARSHSRRSAP